MSTPYIKWAVSQDLLHSKKPCNYLFFENGTDTGYTGTCHWKKCFFAASEHQYGTAHGYVKGKSWIRT